MAENLPQLMTRQITGFTDMPAQRQLGLLMSLALVVVFAIALGSWAFKPSYQVLLPGMSEKDKAQAMTVLARQGIAHKLDSNSGMLMVPATKVHEARLHLATEGLPRAESSGFELLDQDQGIGTSRLQETARYQRALEGELARSIMTINTVDSARVHLALPRQTVFLRDRVQPSASVLVNLHPGRTLDDVQIAGIVHMVASSVPELLAERVTVLDQRGRLLSQNTENGTGTGNGLATWQLDYTRRLEELYRARIEDILSPMVGTHGLRAQVTADVDFTQVESTQEIFDNERQVLRSEQLSEDQSIGSALGGVPGALSNQPPGAGVAQLGQVAATGQGVLLDETEATTDTRPVNRSTRSTRNFEVDRTISHIRQAPASLRRLSVAVVVDHRDAIGAEGQRVREPRDEAELNYMRALVMEAVGFSEDRGDRVNLVNASFLDMMEVGEPLAGPALWEQAWVRDLAKQILGGIGLLLLFLFIGRPVLRSLTGPMRVAYPAGAGRLPGAQAGLLERMPGMDPAQLPGPAGGHNLEEGLNRARNVAQEDPAVVAQVMRQWMGRDEQ